MIALPAHFTLLQVIPRLDTGGAEETTVDIAAAVRAAGGQALVASEGGRMETRLIAQGAELVRLPTNTKNPLMILINGLRLASLVRRRKVTLIHVRSRAPAFSAGLAARLTGAPLVATYHGIYEGRSRLKRWYNGVMTRTDRVIANSGFTRAHVIAQHAVDPARVVAIARGVDLVRFDPAAISPEQRMGMAQAWKLEPDDTRVKIILAGRLTRWKGQALAVEAAGRLKAQGVTDFVLILAGDNQGRAAYLNELYTAIGAQGLQPHIKIVGHCADMPTAYSLCDLAIAPSLKPEAFGRTAVEPQAMGVPVIAADHGAARETVVAGKTGWLAAPNDVQAWTDALAKAIAAGPKRRARMGAAGMTRVRQLYSVKAMGEATLKVYAELAGAPRA